MVDERPPSPAEHRRLRRRGPKSVESILKRRPRLSSRSVRRQPRGGGLCQSRPEPPLNLDGFTLLHLNIRGFISHRAELEAHLAMHCYPTFVGITETLLDQSAVSIQLSGYTLISRLDRRTSRRGGGIAFFARNDSSNFVVHMGDSDLFERSWHILHCNHGPLLIGLWYQPPAYGEIASIKSLSDEIQTHCPSTIGTLLLGDMNVHQAETLFLHDA